MARPRKYPPRQPKLRKMTATCSWCSNTWTGMASEKTLARTLFRAGWGVDFSNPGSWVCPECGAELQGGSDE